MRQLFLLSAVILLLTLTGCGGSAVVAGRDSKLRTESYELGAYRLDLSFPANDIKYGDTVEIVLRIEYPENEKYILLPPSVDKADRFSNTVIVATKESGPVLSGNGMAVSIISFEVEAWLPGEIVFPPLTVSFPEELSTEEIIITCESAFDGDGELRELSPLYIPQAGNFPHPSVLIVSGAAVLIAAALLILFFLRRRKMRAGTTPPEKTREQLIREFGRVYLEEGEAVDLREAFAALRRIPGAIDPEEYRTIVDEARFSKDSIPGDDGLRILKQIYQQLIEESGDEF